MMELDQYIKSFTAKPGISNLRNHTVEKDNQLLLVIL